MAERLTLKDLPEKVAEALLQVHPNVERRPQLLHGLAAHLLAGHALDRDVWVKTRTLVRVGSGAKARVMLQSEAHGRGVSIGGRSWSIKPDGTIVVDDFTHPFLPLEQDGDAS